MRIEYNNVEYKKNFPISSYNSLNIYFSLTEKVPDSVRGELFYENNNWKFSLKDRGKEITTKLIATNDCKKIVLILESPHKDEYDKEFHPILPAQGSTGKHIDSKLIERDFVKILDKKNKYIVLLVNPVQFQASCHHQLDKEKLHCNRKLTIMVFRLLFGVRGANLRKDFINRLKKYSPDIIVNCSTYAVKNIVQTAIKEAGYGDNILQDKHPSVW